MKKIKFFTKLNTNKNYEFILSDITNLSDSETFDLIKSNKLSGVRQQIFSNEFISDLISFLQINKIKISKAYNLLFINGHQSDSVIIELQNGNSINVKTTSFSFFEEDKKIEKLILLFFNEKYNNTVNKKSTS